MRSPPQTSNFEKTDGSTIPDAVTCFGDDEPAGFGCTASGTSIVTPLLSDLPVTLTGTVQDVNVEVNISHPYRGDLQVKLISPAGTEILLMQFISPANADDYMGTVLDDEAGVSIGTCNASSCTGSWQPIEPLSSFDGENPNGQWTLQVTDLLELYEGTLDSWSLTIATTP